MSKFNVNNVSSSVNAVDDIDLDLIQDEGVVAPEGATTSTGSSVADQWRDSTETVEDVTGAVGSFVDEALAPVAPAEMERLDRQSLIPINERVKNPQPDFVASSFLGDTSNNAQYSISPDGGLVHRAEKLRTMVDEGYGVYVGGQGNPAYPLSLGPDAQRGPSLSDSYAEANDGTFFAAASRSDAIQYDPFNEKKRSLDPMFTMLGSVVTENMMMNYFQSLKEGDYYNPEADGMDIAQSSLLRGAQTLPEKNAEIVMSQAKNNSQIGHQINSEYQTRRAAPRTEELVNQMVQDMVSQGVPENVALQQAQSSPQVNEMKTPTRLTTKESEILGAGFKSLWARANPDLVDVYEDSTLQKVYRLTPEGEALIEKGKAERNAVFPPLNVKPNKGPSNEGLSGTGMGSVKKSKSGGASGQRMRNIMNEAKDNLGTIGHFVRPRRMKILISTIAIPLVTGDHTSWQAEINGMGQSKMDQYMAEQALQDRRLRKPNAEREKAYVPTDEIKKQMSKIAAEVQSLAQERKGENFLTFFFQGYQGRLAAQQTNFNLTSSKTVRAVTSAVAPATFKIGSRKDKNYRQMQSMLLVIKQKDSKGNVIEEAAENFLPVVRDAKLRLNEPILYAQGKRLKEALAMTDTEYEAVAEAIAQGVALDSPNFPKFSGLNLDPSNDMDAAIIKNIKSQGQDGIVYMDALIDFSEYLDFKKNRGNPDANQSFSTHLNAYLDGKTHGTATNAILLGDKKMSYKTGVLRTQRLRFLDDGDVRDELIRLADESISTPWENVSDDILVDLNAVSRRVFKDRDLAKLTIMTFGYGKEILSFGAAIDETIELIYQDTETLDPGFVSSLDRLTKEVTREQLADILLLKYAASLENILSEDALISREVSRSAASLFAIMDMPFMIEGATGMDMYIGGMVSSDYDSSDKSTFKMVNKSGEVVSQTIPHYTKTPTASAAKLRGTVAIPGDHAFSGVVVQPVQSIDAAVMALTFSGKSFDRLSKASNGKPYAYPIYDAVKVDVNGYDVMFEEVNQNWMDATFGWSYFKEISKSLDKATEVFEKDIKSRPADEILSAQQSKYMQFNLATVISSNGNELMLPLMKKIKQLTGRADSDYLFDTINMFAREMRKVGYDPFNPPSNPNIKQLRTFYALMKRELKTKSRLSDLITRTEANKKDLRAELLRTGFKTESGKRIAANFFAH
jgi:hypothetical protein